MEMLSLQTQHKAELYLCFSPSRFPPWLFPFRRFQGGEIFIWGVTFPSPACSTGKRLAQMRKHSRNLLEPVWKVCDRRSEQQGV